LSEKVAQAGGLARALQQVGCAEVRGLHAADHVGAGQRGADLLAHAGLAAIATDQVVAAQGQRFAAVQVHAAGDHAVVVLDQRVDPRAVQDRHPARGGRMGEQHRLQVDLVDAVRRLGRRPPGVRPAGGRVAVAPARNRDAREFLAGDVVR
jgi:hypothetical protein